MTYHRRVDPEAIAAIAVRIYCTRLSLGDQAIDLSCVAEDALAIYHACSSCVERAEKG